MALLNKKVLTEGSYVVRTGDGKRVKKVFDKGYINKVVNTSNSMISAGLNTPVPFDHNKEATPFTEEEVKVYDNKTSKSFNNAGYCKRFWTEEEKDGKLSLWAQVDVPGEVEDKDSLAHKVKNNNREVSLSVAKEFEDGLGRKWNDGILHLAVVNHAIVPGQEPFIEGATVVNMSMLDPGSSSESVIDQLKSALSTKLRVSIPESSDVNLFLRDLLTIVTNLPENTNNSGDLEVVPIYMSQGDPDMLLTEAQAKAIVDGKTTNPATNKPYTMEDLGFQKVEPQKPANLEAVQKQLEEKDGKIAQLAGLATALKNKIVDDTKKTISSRISKLVEAGKLSADIAKSTLEPKVDYQMSISDGKIEDHPLEIMLSTLEATATPTTPNPLQGVTLEPQTLDHNVDLSDADMDKALEALEKDGLL